MKEHRTEERPRCPYEWFRELRQSSPVTQLQPGMFAITRCEDVRAVLADPKTFSARVVGNNPFALFGPTPVQGQIDEIMRIYPEDPGARKSSEPDRELAIAWSVALGTAISTGVTKRRSTDGAGRAVK